MLTSSMLVLSPPPQNVLKRRRTRAHRPPTYAAHPDTHGRRTPVHEVGEAAREPSAVSHPCIMLCVGCSASVGSQKHAHRTARGFEGRRTTEAEEQEVQEGNQVGAPQIPY
eukprot:3353086-Pyramimonas_sp.AAC.1